MGFKHEGRGFCTYEGHYQNGHFHGLGTFSCVDGRRYEGHWKRGRKHGFGTAVIIPNSERGDSRRLFIGGVDGMYRAVGYYGDWSEGQRWGQGAVEYANGVIVAGELISGRFEGVARYYFPKSKSVRLGLYELGNRIAWLPASGFMLDMRPPEGVKTDDRTVLMELIGPDAEVLIPEKPSSGAGADRA
jgi:hypothetical protein